MKKKSVFSFEVVLELVVEVDYCVVFTAGTVTFSHWCTFRQFFGLLVYGVHEHEGACFDLSSLFMLELVAFIIVIVDYLGNMRIKCHHWRALCCWFGSSRATFWRGWRSSWGLGVDRASPS